MQTAKPISKKNKIIAALSLLFFVLYCSIGICTNLLGQSSQVSSAEPDMSVVDHSMHAGMSQHEPQNMVSSAHCDDQPQSCDWSINPVVDPIADASPDTTFFLQYLLSGAVLLFSVLLATGHKLSYGYSFVRERCRFSGVPRLHLQQAVFLN